MSRTVRITFAVLICVTISSYCHLFLFDSVGRRRLVHWRIQRIVAAARRQPDDPKYARQLLDFAHGEYNFEATTATVALGDLDRTAGPVVQEIADLMDSENPFVRRDAALSLAKLGPLAAEALPALNAKVSLIGGSSKFEQINFAVFAIGKMGSHARDSLPVLKSKLGNNPN